MSIAPNAVTDWYRCYGKSWKGTIEEEAFAHPAKFSRGLIRHIIEHAIEEGWLKPGDTVLDPFGGVALGALHAMTERLNWVGMELEERFVLMGNRNIQRWEAMYRAGGYEHGSAYLYHGDSRYLALLLDRRVNGCVSSPPYAGSLDHAPGNKNWKEEPTEAQALQGNKGYSGNILKQVDYGNSPAQLGAMKEGEFQAAVSSPPYASIRQDGGGRMAKAGKGGFGAYSTEAPDVWHTQRDQSNMGNLREPAGDFEACVSSPPFEQSLDRGVVDPVERVKLAREMGRLPAGNFEACVSSPPYETSRTDSEFQRQAANPDVDLSMPESTKGYGATGLGRDRTQEAADTFWAASRQVIEQVYQVLTPGAHAIWVCKDFVRHGERVPFTHRWAELCMACGFKWLHEHRAWLTEGYGTQLGLFGENKVLTISRKSFFRRLAERNGAPPIDWESVLCFHKPY